MPSPDSTPRQLRDRLLPPAGPHFVLDERSPILVEFETPDAQATPLSDAAQTQASAQAVNSALNSVRNMAKMMSEAMADLPNAPAQMDVRFGIRLDASGKAFVVESGESASLAVTLTWAPQPAGDSRYRSQTDRFDRDEADEWIPASDAGSPRWESDPRLANNAPAWDYDPDAWEEEADWEQDDRLEDDYPAYEPRGYDRDNDDRGVYEEDEDYDYPEPRSWPRRSPRAPWDRPPQQRRDPRSRWL